MEQHEQSIGRYLDELDRADRQPDSVPEGRVAHLKEKMAAVKAQMRKLGKIGKQLQQAPDQQVSQIAPKWIRASRQSFLH